MFITIKKHNSIVKEKDIAFEELATENLSYCVAISDLQKELGEARDLKDILNKLTVTTIASSMGVACSMRTDTSLPDNIAIYVPDYFGGQVIKQEATKLIEIDKDGKVTHHQTKQASDEGYVYKLVRK